MTRRYLPALVWAAAAALLLLISLVDPGGRWPVSTVATLVMTILTGALLAMWFRRRADEVDMDSATPDPPSFSTLAAPMEERITPDQVPSAMPDYAFVFRATVRWWSTVTPDTRPPGSWNPRAIACATVIERTRAITARHHPLHASLAARELEAALGATQRDSTGRLIVMADGIELTLPEPDRERLERLAAVRKDEELWNLERRWEENRRRYLAEEILRTPGSAVVWWLARNDDDVGRTVADLRALGTLSAVVNNEALPAWFRSHLGETADDAYPLASERPDKPEDAAGDRFFEPSGPGGPGEASGSERATEPAHPVDALLLDADVPPGDWRRPYLIKQIAAVFARNQLPTAAAAIERYLDGAAEIDARHGAGTPEPPKSVVTETPAVIADKVADPAIGLHPRPRPTSDVWSGVMPEDTFRPVSSEEHLLNGGRSDGGPPPGRHLGPPPDAA